MLGYHWFTCRLRICTWRTFLLWSFLFRLIVLFFWPPCLRLSLFVRTIWMLLFYVAHGELQLEQILFYFFSVFVLIFRCFRFLYQLFFTISNGIIYRINCFRNIYIMLLQKIEITPFTFYAELFGDFMDALLDTSTYPLSINLFVIALQIHQPIRHHILTSFTSMVVPNAFFIGNTMKCGIWCVSANWVYFFSLLAAQSPARSTNSLFLLFIAFSTMNYRK